MTQIVAAAQQYCFDTNADSTPTTRGNSSPDPVPDPIPLRGGHPSGSVDSKSNSETCSHTGTYLCVSLLEGHEAQLLRRQILYL